MERRLAGRDNIQLERTGDESSTEYYVQNSRDHLNQYCWRNKHSEHAVEHSFFDSRWLRGDAKFGPGSWLCEPLANLRQQCSRLDSRVKMLGAADANSCFAPASVAMLLGPLVENSLTPSLCHFLRILSCDGIHQVAANSVRCSSKYAIISTPQVPFIWCYHTKDTLLPGMSGAFALDVMWSTKPDLPLFSFRLA